MEKLAGRLKWERTANGIRVHIPGWMGHRVLFFIPWIVFWTFGGYEAFKTFIKTGNSFLLLWLLAWAVGEALVGGSIVWSFLGRIVLTLDPASMNLAYQLGGLQFRTRSFSTHEIRNLRYRPMTHGRWPSRSGICFEQGETTVSFGSGLSDVEAFSLIDEMLEVYPFPKERALEYLDLSR